MAKPLISVVVLTYRRQKELTRTLDSVRAQTYEPRELIVVDNFSGDGTPEFLAGAYPEARLLALAENRGCGARNLGIEAARGEYAITIDNDVRFDSPYELERTAAAFERNPEASVVAFQILHDKTGKLHLRDWSHPRSFMEFANTPFETSYIPEGACAFRRKDFLEVGGYYEPFKIGGEGWDLALRMLDAGHTILYCPEIKVRHSMASETRSERRPNYFYIRNHIWTAYKDYTGWRRWLFLAHSFALVGYFSLRARSLAELFRGIRDGLKGRQGLHPTPISEKAWQRLRRISSQRPGWVTRLKTHWAQRDI